MDSREPLGPITYEVIPCRVVETSRTIHPSGEVWRNTVVEYCEPCKPHEAQFWTLYWRDRDGIATALYDFSVLTPGRQT